MKGLWWKILAIILLFYALLVGSLVPLKPGITSVSERSLETGKVNTFMVNTYNFDRTDLSKTVSYIRVSDDRFIISKDIQPAVNGVELKFEIPSTLPNNKEFSTATLLITDEINGTIVFPDGMLIKQGDAINNEMWNNGLVEPLFKKEGFLFPYRNILLETIRNTFYHVSLWFAMFILFIAATVTSIMFLRTRNFDYDHQSFALISAGVLFGILGLITGMLWAKDTWGTYWTNDVKLNMAAITMMIYLAYLILRVSIEDIDRKAKISSAYAIFAIVAVIPLVFVVPRLTSSLHPGNGGNPAMGGEDMDKTLRMVFYPAVIGFTLLGVWIAQIVLRTRRIQEQFMHNILDK